MFILFLKRLLILGVFFAFFFFACETPFQNSNNQNSTFYNTDNEDTGNTRTRSRSSSSGSSSSRGGGSSSGSSGSGGSSTGEPNGPTVSGHCPSAGEVTKYSPLTTITFGKRFYNNVCEEGRYSHPLYNKGRDDSGRDDSCDYSCDTKYYPIVGSASPNQNTILFINSYDYEIHGSTQQIRLNARVVGELWKNPPDDFYIYFKIQGQEPKKSELKTTSYRWSTCVCSGQSSPVKVTVAEITQEKIHDTDICRKNVVKFWLAKETRTTCEFF